MHSLEQKENTYQFILVMLLYFVTPAQAGVQLWALQNEAGFRLSPE
jgi:hypothetical protein